MCRQPTSWKRLDVMTEPSRHAAADPSPLDAWERGVVPLPPRPGGRRRHKPQPAMEPTSATRESTFDSDDSLVAGNDAGGRRQLPKAS